jgi:hypothetical protein
MTIHEFQQVLWVETPHGDGIAILALDYGVHENMIFLVALQKDGSLKHYSTNQIKVCFNHTIDFNDETKKRIQES